MHVVTRVPEPEPLPDGHELAGRSVEELRAALVAAETELHHREKADRVAHEQAQRAQWEQVRDRSVEIREQARDEDARLTAQVWPAVAAAQQIIREAEAAALRAKAAEDQRAQYSGLVLRSEAGGDPTVGDSASGLNSPIARALLMDPALATIRDLRLPEGA